MDTSAELVIWIHLVKHLDEVVIAVALVEEERKIHRLDDFKLLSEVLVLPLHVTERTKHDLFITEEESIIIQTELANCNDLSHFLSFLRQRNELCNDGVCLFLLELTATSRMNTNCRVETGIRLR